MKRAKSFPLEVERVSASLTSVLSQNPTKYKSPITSQTLHHQAVSLKKDSRHEDSTRSWTDCPSTHHSKAQSHHHGCQCAVYPLNMYTKMPTPTLTDSILLHKLTTSTHSATPPKDKTNKNKTNDPQSLNPTHPSIHPSIHNLQPHARLCFEQYKYRRKKKKTPARARERKRKKRKKKTKLLPLRFSSFKRYIRDTYMSARYAR